MFKKENIKVKKLLTKANDLALCEKYKLDKEVIIVGLEGENNQTILLSTSQLYLVDEVNNKIEKWEIHKPNFNQQTGEINIRYYQKQRSDGIEQSSIQCTKKEFELLLKSFEEKWSAEEDKLNASQNKLYKEEQRTYMLWLEICLLTVVFVITIFILQSMKHAPASFIFIQCLPLFLSGVWICLMRHLIKSKYYTKDLALLTLIMSIVFTIVISILNHRFYLWYGVNLVLFNIPALYFLTVQTKQKVVNTTRFFLSFVALSLLSGGVLYYLNTNQILRNPLHFFDFQFGLAFVFMVVGFILILTLRVKKIMTYILFILIGVSLTFTHALNFDMSYTLENDEKITIDLASGYPFYNVHKSSDYYNYYRIDNYNITLSKSEKLLKIEKRLDEKFSQLNAKDVYLLTIERQDATGHTYLSKEIWQYGIEPVTSLYIFGNGKNLIFYQLVARDENQYTNTGYEKRATQDGVLFIPVLTENSIIKAESLGKNRLVITPSKNEFGDIFPNTQCATLLDEKGEIVIGGIPYTQIEEDRAQYVMKSTIANMTYTFYKDGTFKKEQVQNTAPDNRDAFSARDDERGRITISKRNNKEKIFEIETTKLKKEKDLFPTIVNKETGDFYAVYENKYYEGLYQSNQVHEVTKEYFFQKVTDYAKTDEMYTKFGDSFIFNAYDFTARHYNEYAFNKSGQVVKSKKILTIGSTVFAYDEDGVIRLNPDLTEDTTFDQAKFNRIFEYKGKTYFYNDKAPTEMYDENGARVELK